MLHFVTSLVELFSDDLMKDFLKSDTLFNYERMMEMLNMEDEEFIHCIIAGSPSELEV